jgi:hypothetical protein
VVDFYADRAGDASIELPPDGREPDRQMDRDKQETFTLSINRRNGSLKSKAAACLFVV